MVNDKESNLLAGNKTLPSTPESKQEQDESEQLSAQSLTKPPVADSSNKDALYKKGRFAADINKISAEDTFIINDVTLAIPPTAIRIDKQNIHYKWHTLRSSHPAKVKSGHGQIQVSLSIYFVGTKAINEGLRRLVVQLEHSPFAYVDNRYLRDNIAPGTNNNMAFTILDFTVRTEPGLVDALVLDLDMTWFNYFPFSRNFMYRETWEPLDQPPEYRLDNESKLINMSSTDPVVSQNIIQSWLDGGDRVIQQSYDPTLQARQDMFNENMTYLQKEQAIMKPANPVKKPSQSVPYRLYYDKLQNERALISSKDSTLGQTFDNQPVLQQALTFKYFEYKQVHLPSNLKFLGTRQLRPGELSKVSTGDLQLRGDVTLLMREKAARDLELLAQAFSSQFNIPLPITSCFRTFEEQAILSNQEHTKELASKPGTSYHEVGLAVDIGVKSLTANQYIWIVLNAPKLPNGGFLVNRNVRSRAGSNESKLREIHEEGTLAERWHFTHQSSDNNVERLLKRIYRGNDESLPQEKVSSGRADYATWLKKHLEGGWENVTHYPRIFRRPIEFSLDASDTLPSPPGNKLVISSLAVSMNNLVASLPLLSHQYASHQYMGSTDKDIFISLLAHGTGKLTELQMMNSVLEHNARVFRKVPESSIAIVGANNIMKFMTIDKVLIESINTETIPGNPDLFNVNIKMTQWTTPRDLLFTEFATDTALREQVIQRLLTQISGPHVETEDNKAENLQLRGKIQLRDKNILGFIRPATYKIVPKAIKGVMPVPGVDEFLLGSDGLLERLIQIIRGLNLILVNEEAAKLLRYHHGYVMSLYGAEKLVHPEAYTFVAEEVATGERTEISTTTAGRERIDKRQREAIVLARKRLDQLADDIIATHLLEDKFFQDIFEHVSGTIINGRPAYPDLNLPPHPLTGETIDTNPDWYFWNDAEEGKEAIVQPDLKEQGKQLAMNSYSSYTRLNNGRWYDSTYLSPNRKKIKDGKERSRLETDGYVAPDSSVDRPEYKSSFEINDKKKANNLSNYGLFAKGRNSEGQYDKRYKGNNPHDSVSFGSKSAGRSSLHDFGNTETGLQKTYDLAVANMSNDQNTMRRAFPTFKIYFIENETLIGQSNESNKRLRGFDDFYSYSAIKDIRIIRSRKIPADLAVVTMTNVAGLLDGRAFYSGKSQRKDRTDDVGPFNPDMVLPESQNNPWEGIILREGQKIQIRLGYSNNPNNLEVVFNGQVAEVGPSESGDLIQIVCQSYAVELVQQIKGLDISPDNIGESKNIGDTQELLATMICEPEVVHFGRWAPNAEYNPAEIQVRGTTDTLAVPGILSKAVRQAVTERWQLLNSPQDDNIYAPSQSEYYSWYRKILDWNLLDYYIVHTTVWDIFQEMELRHPGWISYPVPYEDRYTMFFGVASQHYWSRPPDMAEIRDIHLLKKARKQQRQEYREKFSRAMAGRSAASHYAIDMNIPEIEGDFSLLNKDKYILEAARLAGDRFTPFRKYHMLTSEHNIISNNIMTDAKNSINAVAVEYRTTGKVRGEYDLNNTNVLTVKADDNISDQNTRVLHTAFMNCEKRFMARNYALGLLLRHLKDIYTGEVCIVGDARIKPHDVCYIMDSYSDMFGQIGVEQVTHILSFQDGFVTKIVPDLIVTGNEWYNAPVADAIQKLVVDTYKQISVGNFSIGGVEVESNVIGATVATELGIVAAAAAPVTFTLGLGILAFGGFKLFQWTQERQPVHVNPLLLHGIPYIAGLDDFEHQNIWMYVGGKLRNWATGDKDDGNVDDFFNQLRIQYSSFTNNWENNILDILQGKVN
jgi:hypothetical protein